MIPCTGLLISWATPAASRPDPIEPVLVGASLGRHAKVPPLALCRLPTADAQLEERELVAAREHAVAADDQHERSRSAARSTCRSGEVTVPKSEIVAAKYATQPTTIGRRWRRVRYPRKSTTAKTTKLSDTQPSHPCPSGVNDKRCRWAARGSVARFPERTIACRQEGVERHLEREGGRGDEIDRLVDAKPSRAVALPADELHDELREDVRDERREDAERAVPTHRDRRAELAEEAVAGDAIGGLEQRQNGEPRVGALPGLAGEHERVHANPRQMPPASKRLAKYHSFIARPPTVSRPKGEPSEFGRATPGRPGPGAAGRPPGTRTRGGQAGETCRRPIPGLCVESAARWR